MIGGQAPLPTLVGPTAKSATTRDCGILEG